MVEGTDQDRLFSGNMGNVSGGGTRKKKSRLHVIMFGVVLPGEAWPKRVEELPWYQAMEDSKRCSRGQGQLSDVVACTRLLSP